MFALFRSFLCCVFSPPHLLQQAFTWPPSSLRAYAQSWASWLCQTALVNDGVWRATLTQGAVSQDAAWQAITFISYMSIKIEERIITDTDVFSSCIIFAKWIFLPLIKLPSLFFFQYSLRYKYIVITTTTLTSTGVHISLDVCFVRTEKMKSIAASLGLLPLQTHTTLSSFPLSFSLFKGYAGYKCVCWN